MIINSHRIICLALLCAFLACNTASFPTEADAKKVLENQIVAKGQTDTVRVNIFRKLKGQISEFNGAKTYTLEYEAELEYLRDIPETATTKGVSKGAKEKIKGTIKFDQTANGWIGEDEKLY